jgi:AcrR family transcriptional regulator
MGAMPPPTRADAARNRRVLIEVATRVFSAPLAEGAAEPSLRAIAREAGVGIGTLFRHFPTREALVDAVYQDQVERLTHGAQKLLAAHPPAEALRRWMDLFADWMVAKHGMLDTLRAMIDQGRVAHADTRTALLAAIDTILDAGRAAGDIRPGTTAEDVAAALIGVLTVATDPAQATRLLDIFMAGLRVGGADPAQRR